MISGKILLMQIDIHFTAQLHFYHHTLFLVLLVKCCHWKQLLCVTTFCVTVLWFGFLCAAKDQKALLFLGQMLLQVSATKRDVASLSMKTEDFYTVVKVCPAPMKADFCVEYLYAR